MNNALAAAASNATHIFRRPHVGDSFLGWTLRRWYVTYWMTALAGLRILYNTLHLQNAAWFRWNNDLVQAVLIVGMILAWILSGFTNESFLHRAQDQVKLAKPEERDEELAQAAKSTRVFYWFWFLVLCSWLAFYLADLELRKSSHVSTLLHQYGALDMVNALEAVWFLAAYAEMTVISVRDGVRTHAAQVWIVGVAAAYIAFVTLEMLIPGPWWSVASGLWVGVAMALLIGRFESHLIKAPLLLTACLFLYAVIQLLYPLFYVSGLMEALCPTIKAVTCGQVRAFQDIVTLGALPLKILMFFAVDWMYFGGRLLFYMYEARSLLRKDAGWKEFLAKVRPA